MERKKKMILVFRSKGVYRSRTNIAAFPRNNTRLKYTTKGGTRSYKNVPVENRTLLSRDHLYRLPHTRLKRTRIVVTFTKRRLTVTVYVPLSQNKPSTRPVGRGGRKIFSYTTGRVSRYLFNPYFERRLGGARVKHEEYYYSVINGLACKSAGVGRR